MPSKSEPPKRASGGRHYGEELGPGARSPASYAASAVPSRGRRYEEPECTARSPFQRDRDRILHSTAFRRLTHKTQVFLFHEGDHYRTRLTHTLEVAQIARTISRQLRLDEDLAEALALAHDLGHPPFGHAGERALDAAMKAYGGFDHNAQSLRAVIHLERKYLAFDGLNLTWEALEGLAKHNGPVAAPKGAAVLKVIRPLEEWCGLEPSRWASAEAQVAALSDDIAYVTHDVDDGLRAGVIGMDDLESVAVAGDAVREAGLPSERRTSGRAVFEVTRRMITRLIRDVVGTSREALAGLAPEDPDDIRDAGRAVVLFSAPLEADLASLKRFLLGRVYRHERVMRVMSRAETIVTDLFHRYMADERAMPEAWRAAAAGGNERRRARVIADFVAGMTDRYAIEEHRRLFDGNPELR
jgi:dGTPase